MAKTTPEVQAAVDYLVQSYGDINAQARGFALNANDVQTALASADVDSAEYVALQALANANPTIPVSIKTSKAKANVINDVALTDNVVTD